MDVDIISLLSKLSGPSADILCAFLAYLWIGRGKEIAALQARPTLAAAAAARAERRTLHQVATAVARARVSSWSSVIRRRLTPTRLIRVALAASVRA